MREESANNPRHHDAESGLYHYRARAYSPDVGRFLQQDPAGMVDGANMYAYVGNNPVNKVDPTGMVVPTWFDEYGRWTGSGSRMESLQISDPQAPIIGSETSDQGPGGGVDDCQEKCRCESAGGYYPCNWFERRLRYNYECYQDCNFVRAFYAIFQDFLKYATMMKPHGIGVAHM